MPESQPAVDYWAEAMRLLDQLGRGQIILSSGNPSTDELVTFPRTGLQIGPPLDPSAQNPFTRGLVYESIGGPVPHYNDPGISGQNNPGVGVGGGGSGGSSFSLNIGGGGGGKKKKKRRQQAERNATLVLGKEYENQRFLEGERGQLAGLLGSDAQANDAIPAIGGEGGAAESAATSPAGRLIGSQLRDARSLLDPASEATARFKDSLTSAALADIEGGRLASERSLSSAERTGERGRRDTALAYGSSANPNARMAFGARSAERFGSLRAGVETGAATERAKVHGAAAQFYETFSRQYAFDAVGASRAFVNDAAFVRDSYRQMQLTLATNIANAYLKVGGIANDRRDTNVSAGADVAGSLIGAAAAIYANRKT